LAATARCACILEGAFELYQRLNAQHLFRILIKRRAEKKLRVGNAVIAAVALGIVLQGERTTDGQPLRQPVFEIGLKFIFVIARLRGTVAMAMVIMIAAEIGRLKNG
jgi:hypothetical protein